MSQIFWDLPLDEPPQIANLGIGRHGQGSEAYQLNGLWCIHLYRYHGEMALGPNRIAIRPGSASLVPADTIFAHVWPSPVNVHISVHFQTSGGGTRPTPIMQPLGERFEMVWDEILEAARLQDSAPKLLQAKVWGLLWQMAVRPDPQRMAGSLHPCLSQAQVLIQERLAEPISIAALADEIGISHNHLIRLFRNAHGQTVQSYIRARRAERARYLLTHTTKPIKAIAVEVGMPDVQSLNKTLRKVYGKSPRAVREATAD
jgi:AraC-like DNA-binding protein